MSTPRQISKILNMMNLETNKVVSSVYDSDTIAVTSNKGASTPTGTLSVTSADNLPTNPLIGTQAVVSSTGRFYVFNGNGWYNVATINSTPYWIDEANATYELNTDGTATVIEINAGDSDNTTPIYTATGDSNFNAIATVVQDSEGRFVVRSIDSDGSISKTDGSGILTFIASDGIDQASTASTFSLTFGPNWANPTSTQITPTTSIAGENFGAGGSAISKDGNYAIVSAMYETSGRGAVYVFTVSGSTFTQQAKLIPSVNNQTWSFGDNVAINSDGTYIAVGCKFEPLGGNAGQGAVYIFTRSGSTWTEQQRILNPLISTGAQYFGANVAIDDTGTYLLITEYSHHEPSPPSPYTWNNTGTVHFYTRSGSTWTKQSEVKPTGLAASDYYGASVSMTPDGTYAIIGATLNERNIYGAGAAYVWTRSGSTWTQQAMLTASDGAGNDYFGQNVSISEDSNYAIVAASNTDGNSTGDGAVYVFTRSGSSWTQQAKLIAPDTVNTDAFGGVNMSDHRMDINSDGTIVAVSAAYKDVSGYLGVGRIYIFKRDGSTWSQTDIIDKPGVLSKDYYYFGYSVSMSSDGSSILTGANLDDVGGLYRAGAAYFLEA